MIHIIKYIKTEKLANDTAAFYFEKPENFNYRAGQFGEFSLINPPETDGKGNSRTFTLASSPDEEYLIIATRLRDSAFKRVLKTLLPGAELILEAPLGVFTLPKDLERPLVFLAGGIGITPFRSMVTYATTQKIPNKIFLFYSNHEPSDAPYLEELIELQKYNSNYKIINTMTRVNKTSSEWNGETGYITTEMLDKYLGDLVKPLFYLAGPSEMLKSLQKTLIDKGINKDDIKTEEFLGY